MYSDDNQGCGHVVHTSLDMSGSRTKLKIVSGASPWSIIIVELSKIKLWSTGKWAWLTKSGCSLEIVHTVPTFLSQRLATMKLTLSTF